LSWGFLSKTNSFFRLGKYASAYYNTYWIMLEWMNSYRITFEWMKIYWMTFSGYKFTGYQLSLGFLSKTKSFFRLGKYAIFYYNTYWIVLEWMNSYRITFEWMKIYWMSFEWMKRYWMTFSGYKLTGWLSLDTNLPDTSWAWDFFLKLIHFSDLENMPLSHSSMNFITETNLVYRFWETLLVSHLSMNLISETYLCFRLKEFVSWFWRIWCRMTFQWRTGYRMNFEWLNTY